jgi:hypothetical protein
LRMALWQCVFSMKQAKQSNEDGLAVAPAATGDHNPTSAAPSAVKSLCIGASGRFCPLSHSSLNCNSTGHAHLRMVF